MNKKIKRLDKIITLFKIAYPIFLISLQYNIGINLSTHRFISMENPFFTVPLYVCITPLAFSLIDKLHDILLDRAFDNYKAEFFSSDKFAYLQEQVAPLISHYKNLTYYYLNTIQPDNFLEYHYIPCNSRQTVNNAEQNPVKYVRKYYIDEMYKGNNHKAIQDLTLYLNNYKNNQRKFNAVVSTAIKLDDIILKYTDPLLLDECYKKLDVPSLNVAYSDRNKPKLTTVIFGYKSPKRNIPTDCNIELSDGFVSLLIHDIKHNASIDLEKESFADERSKLTPALRTKIFERDNFTCVYCGANRANGMTDELHCDHIYPISRGGKTVESNLQTLCKNCNLNKSDKWRDIDQEHYKARNNGKLPYQ